MHLCVSCVVGQVYEGVYVYGAIVAEVKSKDNQLLLTSSNGPATTSAILAYKAPLRFQVMLMTPCLHSKYVVSTALLQQNTCIIMLHNYKKYIFRRYHIQTTYRHVWNLNFWLRGEHSSCSDHQSTPLWVQDSPSLDHSLEYSLNERASYIIYTWVHHASIDYCYKHSVCMCSCILCICAHSMFVQM